ncbi:hypothetical protein V5799_023109 [Amblyomma americanum]|uniref:Uncharacterized protein n=1 Tax=Amblyomma americanum TaxID=6943 RepID=A0AAQ4FK57_AMBAM
MRISQQKGLFTIQVLTASGECYYFRKYDFILNWRRLPGKENQPRLETGRIFGQKLPNEVHSTYAILYASPFCIILGAEFPPGRVKTDCTYWTKFKNIGTFHWQCEFILNLYCKEPTYVVKNATECWK